MNDMPDTPTAKTGFRGRVYDDIVDAIGDTPLVRLKNLAALETLETVQREGYTLGQRYSEPSHAFVGDSDPALLLLFHKERSANTCLFELSV